VARQVVVTGCSRGIGRALVEAFQERGIAVAGCARSSNAVAELGPAPRFRPLDVCDGDGLEDWVRDLEADQFEADLVIANAGTLNVRAPFWKVSNKEFSDVVDVNVKGVFQTLKAFTPGMIERGRGTLVALSSGWGRSTSPEVAPYCASKFAIEGLMGSIAQELPGGLAAVALSPGVVHTEMLKRAFGEKDASMAVEPSDWGREAVEFLLSLGPDHSGSSLSFQR